MTRQPHNHATENHNGSAGTTPSLAREHADVTPMARTHRELAMLVEKQSRQFEIMLSEIQALRATRAAAPEQTSHRDRILAILVTHGHRSTAELMHDLNLTKQQVHHHIGTLEMDRQVVVVRSPRNPQTGRRGADIVYHASAIAI